MRNSMVLDAYVRHLGALKHYVARILPGHQHDVEDVLQEAFVLAYKAENTKDIYQPKAYLFQTARNVALTHLRHRTRHPTDYLEDCDAADIPASDWTLEDELIVHQKLELHCAAVAALPPQCRKVYLLRKIYGMSYKEIAKMMDITVSTVETHLEKGFARCAAYFEKHAGDGGDGLFRKEGGA